jgi:hypothetical protein
MALPIAAPVVLICGAVLSGGIVGQIIGGKIYNLIKSDIWIERTERELYEAPNGHVIYADPTY